MVLEEIRDILKEPTYERALLSYVINNVDNYYDIVAKVDSSDFLHESNAVIYEAIAKLVRSGIKAFDVPLIAEELDKSGDLSNIGGLSYLESLKNFRLSSINIDAAMSKVVEASTKFQLYKKLHESQLSILSASNTSEDLISRVENDVLTLASSSLAVSEPKDLADGLEDYIESLKDTKIEISGIDVGYPILTKQIDGMVPGTLFVVAARKKQGKSALLTNMALHVAVNLKKPVLYIDTELTFNEWRNRALAIVSGVPERVIKHGGYSKKEYEMLVKAVKRVKESKIFHEYMPGYTVDRLAALYKQYKFKENIEMGIFDYIKEPDSVSLDRSRKEYQILGDVTTKLKDLAGQLDIPFLTAVQLSRAGDIADSDRIARYGDVIAHWSILEESREPDADLSLGTNKLVIKDTRRGGATPEEGIRYIFRRRSLRIVEVEPSKQVIDYTRDYDAELTPELPEETAKYDDSTELL